MRTRQRQMLEVCIGPDGSGIIAHDNQEHDSMVAEKRRGWLMVAVVVLLFGGAASTAQPMNTLPRILHGAFGRQIVFYPFDSVQFSHSPARFGYITSDVVVPNPSEADPLWQLPLSEAIYQHSQTAGLVASGIRITTTTQAGRALNNHWLLGQQRTDIDSSRCGYFVVTGHLFDSFTTPNTAAIFRVAVYHQVLPGQRYLTNSLAVATAGAKGIEILVDSFTVNKEELLGTWPYQAMREYREIAHRTDFYWRAHDGGPGPLHPNQPNGREQALDIRVYWTGAEKAALRSVAFRDSLGELVLGKSQASIDFRDSIVREARMILQGSPTAAPTDPIHPAIFRLESGHDNAACSTAVTRLLKEVLLQTKGSLGY